MELSHLAFIILGQHLNTYLMVTVIITAQVENFGELGNHIKHSTLKFDKASHAMLPSVL